MSCRLQRFGLERIQSGSRVFTRVRVFGRILTNLKALPPDVDKFYQQYRLRTAKTKIARGLFLSVRDEPELDQLFDANRCFEIALQQMRIEDAYWKVAGHSLKKRNFLSRFIVWPLRKAEFAVIRTAGFFTDWGRSPLKSVWFLTGAVAVFSALYKFVFAEDLASALLRALDCTFVFGYTKYSSSTCGQAWVMFLNAFAGFLRCPPNFVFQGSMGIIET